MPHWPAPTWSQSRPKLWAAAGLWAGILLIAFDVVAAVASYIPEYRVRDDFRLLYSAALAGRTHGYGHLYDFTTQQETLAQVGGGFFWQPYLSPPPLAWLATPLTALPFDSAILIWTLLIGAALVGAWYLAAPGRGIVRLAQLALWLGLFPVAFGIMVGQPVALVAAAVALAWWLSERHHPLLAGAALSLIVLKPQLGLLVPASLLVGRRPREFAGWLVATALAALVALAMLGPEGVARYRAALDLASQWELTRRFAVAGLVGTGPQLRLVQAVVVLTTLAAAWRNRRASTGVLIAIGICGSLLVTPYLGFQDFAMLVLAGWLLLRAGVTHWHSALLVAGYLLLEFSQLLFPLPIVAAEVLLLVGMFWLPPPPGPAAGTPQARLNRAPT